MQRLRVPSSAHWLYGAGRFPAASCHLPHVLFWIWTCMHASLKAGAGIWAPSFKHHFEPAAGSSTSGGDVELRLHQLQLGHTGHTHRLLIFTCFCIVPTNSDPIQRKNVPNRRHTELQQYREWGRGEHQNGNFLPEMLATRHRCWGCETMTHF